MDILDLLRSDGSIVINKKLAQKIGLDQAIIYSELVSLLKYWSNKGKLVDNKWFFCTIENLEENTTIKRDRQSRAINQLTKIGLIETKRMGLPAKRYFAITDGILNLIENKFTQNAETGSTNGSNGKFEGETGSNPHSDQITQNAETGSSKMRKLDYAKCDTNNTISNNTISNNTKENLSITLEKTNLHLSTQKRLLKQDMIDRLILLPKKLLNKIENLIQDIEDLQAEYKNILTIDQFNSCLVDCLKANISKNFKQYLRNALDNKTKAIQDKTINLSDIQKTNEPELPEWFKSRKPIKPKNNTTTKNEDIEGILRNFKTKAK